MNANERYGEIKSAERMNRWYPVYPHEQSLIKSPYPPAKFPPVFYQVTFMLSILATGAAAARQGAQRWFGDLSGLCLTLAGSLVNGNEQMHLRIHWRDSDLPKCTFKDDLQRTLCQMFSMPSIACKFNIPLNGPQWTLVMLKDNQTERKKNWTEKGKKELKKTL